MLNQLLVISGLMMALQGTGRLAPAVDRADETAAFEPRAASQRLAATITGAERDQLIAIADRLARKAYRGKGAGDFFIPTKPDGLLREFIVERQSDHYYVSVTLILPVKPKPELVGLVDMTLDANRELSGDVRFSGFDGAATRKQ